ncbi:YadA-like family protein [Bartonella sp. B41]
MKTSYPILKENDLKENFLLHSAKTISLGTALITLLSSIFPVYAANLAITGANKISTNLPGVAYLYGSHGSVVLSGDDDYCGADKVYGRGKLSEKTEADNVTGAITAKEQYERFLNEKLYDDGKYNPYGTMTSQSIWTGDGRASKGGGYMGASTGGFTNVLPEAYGLYSFVTGCGASAIGNYSTAFGAGATTRAGGAQAFGVSALAAGKASVAIGIGSEAAGVDSIALGSLASAGSKGSLAIGHASEAAGEFSIVLGSEASATGDHSLALGSNSKASENNAVSLGHHALVKGINGLALGYNSEAVGSSSVALGAYAAAAGSDSIALGSIAKSAGEASVALGYLASAVGTNSLAFGRVSKAEVENSVAIGSYSAVNKGDIEPNQVGYDPLTNGAIKDITTPTWKSTLGAVSVGDNQNGKTRQIKSVAAGSDDTDAVNVAQLKKLREYATSGWKVTINGDTTSPVVFDKDSSLNFSVSNKNLNITKGDGNANVAFGLSDDITLKSVKTGGNSLTESGLDVGNVHITSTGINSGDKKITEVLNGDVYGSSKDAINGSQLYSMSNTLASYFGGGAKYDDGKWTAPTFKVSTISADGTHKEESYNNVASAFSGVGSSFTNLDKKISDKINKLSDDIKNVTGNGMIDHDTSTNVISVGGNEGGHTVDVTNNKDESRVVSGVKDGAVSSGSTDAINGSQLYSMGSTLASYFGGGAKYDDGKWTAPTFKVSTISADGTHKEESYNNVASAFSGVGSSFTNLDKKISDKINKLSDDIKNVTGNGMIDHDTSTNVISVGGNEGGHTVDVTNNKDESRVVSGVKDGAVSSGSTDAINGSQLYSMGSTLASYFGGGAKYDDGKWTAPTFKVSTISADGTHKEESYNNVASAFSGVGSSFTNLDKKISDKINKLSDDIKNVTGNGMIDHDTSTNVISVGGNEGGHTVDVTNNKDESRVVSGVKDGAVSSGSTDAINGSQLYSMGSTLASYFGGGAKYDDGKWTAPTFKVSTISADGTHKEESYNNVASAFSGVGSSFTNLDKKISDKINKLSDDIKNVTGNGMIDHDTSTNVISVGGNEGGHTVDVTNNKDESRVVSGVKDGAVSSGSTDAINGSQLYSMSNTLASYFGGGAKYDDGKWTAPTFKFEIVGADGTHKEESYQNVFAAFNGFSESMLSLSDRVQVIEKGIDPNILENAQELINGGHKIEEIENKVDVLSNTVTDIGHKLSGIETQVNVVTDGVIAYDRGEDGGKSNTITLAGGNESEPVLIDNLADGRVEEGSKEAVNGGQLYSYTKEQIDVVFKDAQKYTDESINNAVNGAKIYTDMQFESLKYGIDDVRKEAKQAAAIGLAVSNLRYYDVPGSLSFSFGSGLWSGQSAFAIGAGYTSEDGNVLSNLSITTSGGNWGIGGGITLRMK